MVTIKSVFYAHMVNLVTLFKQCLKAVAALVRVNQDIMATRGAMS